MPPTAEVPKCISSTARAEIGSPKNIARRKSTKVLVIFFIVPSFIEWI
jgi:hypothetical protein